MTSFDVVVVGAGPAGVASALKCASQGYNTLLMEKGQPGRYKSCGGIVPTLCADMLKEEFGLKLPHHVMCSPETLGLFYVPPSGRDNAGERSNYRLLNLNRVLFDQWLCETAVGSGVKLLYGATFLEFEVNGMIKIMLKHEDSITELRTKYLIGADGIFSKVRKQLYPNLKGKAFKILQEYWQAKGDFGEYFYVFFKGEITPSYTYLVPKNGIFVIGAGVPMGYPLSIHSCLERFKKLLSQEFAFKPLSLERKEIGAIPYPSTFNGKGNVILAGDAAGFCNSFSGEGIRLAIESGIATSNAITQAEQSGDWLSSLYAQQVKGLNEFIRKTYKFSMALKDREKEQFVAKQIKRTRALSIQ